mmetsp:Transcript_25590/g.78974  ORF Transcript_25590/g.78974 Transcript_25590/m.78974 type:complete len:293 (-) Transcript_25590:764-1642(-)
MPNRPPPGCCRPLPLAKKGLYAPYWFPAFGIGGTPAGAGPFPLGGRPEFANFGKFPGCGWVVACLYCDEPYVYDGEGCIDGCEEYVEFRASYMGLGPAWPLSGWSSTSMGPRTGFGGGCPRRLWPLPPRCCGSDCALEYCPGVAKPPGVWGGACAAPMFRRPLDVPRRSLATPSGCPRDAGREPPIAGISSCWGSSRCADRRRPPALWPLPRVSGRCTGTTLSGMGLVALGNEHTESIGINCGQSSAANPSKYGCCNASMTVRRPAGSTTSNFRKSWIPSLLIRLPYFRSNE